MFGISILGNFDLLSVGVAIASSLILGFIIYFQKQKDLTNRAFLFFVFASSAWGIANYLFYKIGNTTLSLWSVRLVMFFAVWQAFTFLLLTYVFPGGVTEYPWWIKRSLFPGAIIVSALTLTPLIFRDVVKVVGSTVPKTIQGPAIPIFGIFSVGIVVAGLIILIKKMIHTKRKERKPFYSFITGLVLMFGFIIVFNFILPIFLYNVRYIPLGAVFILPFVFFTFFTIVRHGLLNIKIIGTEILTFVLAISTLFEVIFADNIAILVFRISMFLLVLSIGLLLIKTVTKEVKQREELAVLAKNLENANTKLKELDDLKTEFLSIATHQLRTPLSIIKGYIELIEDGAYGKPSRKLAVVLHNMDVSNERLVKLVDEFLNVTRIEQGRTQYHFEKMDFGAMVKDVLKELTEKASQKQIIFKDTVSGKLAIIGDVDRLRHGVFNFVDNAIKYSPAGSVVNIRVGREKAGVAVRVMDQGPGLDEKDLNNLFQKFYRSPNVSRDFEGTGLGIYVCRKFIEAHGGRVWAKSEGIGKGSEFGFWVPEKQPNS